MISPKMFLTKWRLHFWQSCRKFFTRSSKEFYEPIIFCKQTISFQKLLWKRRILPISFHPTTQQNHEFVCFFKQKISPTMLLWYIRLQFWQPFRKVFTWSPQKIIKMKVFFKKNSLTMFLWWSRMQFWQFCRNFSIRSLKKII